MTKLQRQEEGVNFFKAEAGVIIKVPSNPAIMPSKHADEHPETPDVLLAIRIPSRHGFWRIANQSEITKLEELGNCLKIFAPHCSGGKNIELLQASLEMNCAESRLAYNIAV